MKQTIRLNEQELNALITESVMKVMNESKALKNMPMNESMNEEMDEGILGMLGGRLARPIIKYVVNIIARTLNLDQNGALYRVLTSKLFAMALGNEIENSIRLHKQEGSKPMNGLNGGIGDANGNGKLEFGDIMSILGIKKGNDHIDFGDNMKTYGTKKGNIHKEPTGDFVDYEIVDDNNDKNNKIIKI